MKRLSLNYVQDWGQHADGTPMQSSEGYYFVDSTDHENRYGSRGVVRPGSMRGLLPSIESRCLSLTSLFSAGLARSLVVQGVSRRQRTKKSILNAQTSPSW